MPFRDEFDGRIYNTRIGYAVDTVVGGFFRSVREETMEYGPLSYLPVGLIMCSMPFFIFTEYTAALRGIGLKRIDESKTSPVDLDLIE